MKKAFTLAEVMIVLTVIGVLTAILLPVARQSMPDENLMKFKKAHNTLGAVIRELVTSDKYYLDGDLGLRPNGDLIDGSHAGDYIYLCQSMADVMNVKKIKCAEEPAQHTAVILKSVPSSFDLENGVKVTEEILQAAKLRVDAMCAENLVLTKTGEELILNDGVVFYQTNSYGPFGKNNCNTSQRCFSSPSEATPTYYDENGFDTSYKMFCVDIDGINTGEDPFGYGIRADGKIFVGARAQEWLERDVNEE